MVKNPAVAETRSRIIKLVTSELSVRAMKRKSTTWYFPSDEFTSFFNLQKSQYENFYYVNTGTFTDDIKTTTQLPPQYKAGIRLRLLSIIPDNVKDEVGQCLHLEHPIDWEVRRSRLVSFLKEYAAPMIAQLQSLAEINRLYRSGALNNAFITVEAKSRLCFPDMR